MQTRRLEEKIIKWSGRTASELDLRSRALRADSLLPVTGRGPHAANLAAVHVKNFLLGLRSEKASEAAEVVKIFDPMVPLRGGFANADTFGEAITAALADHGLFLHQAILSRMGSDDETFAPPYYAEIVWGQRGEKIPTQNAIYVPKSDVPHLQKQGGDDWLFATSRIRDAMIIGGGLINQLAIEIADEDEPAGWANDVIGRQAAEQFRKAARRRVGDDDDNR